MCHAHQLPRRRNAYTLIELLVVMALIVVIFSLGIGYVVFGQDNQHSVSAAQTITGAMLNAKQRARRDGVPTGIRILFVSGKDAKGNPVSWASQLQFVQQPPDYTAGTCQGSSTPTNTLTFTGNVDFQGGAAYMGEATLQDEATIEIGDYFTLNPSGDPTAHRINAISGAVGGPQTITMDSKTNQAVASGASYAIIRSPRRLPSEDVIQLPSTMVIDNSGTLCQNLPLRTLTDAQQPPQQVAEIVFAPSGAVIGQGAGANMVLLWVRDSSQASSTGGAPLIVSVQTRTGMIGTAPIAPGSNPYAFAQDPRASGM